MVFSNFLLEILLWAVLHCSPLACTVLQESIIFTKNRHCLQKQESLALAGMARDDRKQHGKQHGGRNAR